MKLNIVPARTGILWVKLGIRTFLKQPLALVTLFFTYMAVMFMLSVVPGVGPALAAIVLPGMALGMMAASKEAEQGRFPMPTVLLSAFRVGRQRLRAMLVLGLIYGAGWFLVILLANMLAPLPAPDAAATPAAQAQIAWFYLVVLALHSPLTILFWHAPALVHWHEVSPLKSLFFSTVACFRNFGAFTIYGIAWMGVFLVFLLMFGLIGAAIGSQAGAQVVLVPLAMLLGAMFSTSIYFTFRDSFVATTDEQQPPGDQP